MPIERAAPATIAIADSIVSQLRSGSLISAIFLTCALVTEPTLLRFGVPEPFSTPASFFSRTAAGGVLVMKEKDLSAKIVISTGRAVPTGGAGFALPAGICSLTKPTAFFAMILLSYCQPSSSVGAAYDSHGLISVVVVSDGALLASSAAPRKGHHLRRE